MAANRRLNQPPFTGNLRQVGEVIMKKMIKYWNKPSRSAYLFLAPSVILLILFSVVPLIIAFGLSLFDVSITMDSARFIGFENFAEAFQDSRFINSLKVTAIFTGLEVPLQVLGALVVAALIAKNNIKNKIFRAVYFLPVICSATAIGIMWKMILHSNIGFVTAALQSMGLGKINFLNTPGLTIFVVSFISIWRSFGISAIIYVTAIQQVSASLYEAAEMDGAGKIRQFAGALQIFDIIYITTNGGPNYTTESTVTYIYSRAFSSRSSMGYASAMSVILFAIIMVVTVLMYHKMNQED